MGAVFRHMPSPLLQRAAVWCKAVKPPRAIPRCTYGRHGDTGVWLPPGDTGDTKTVRISTVKGKCIDGCTEADLAYIYALLSL